MHNFIENIKRLFIWIPIIWKDRDWDYCHLFKIMNFKLGRMSRDEGYDKYLLRGNRYKRQLQYAEYLSNLLINFDHHKDDEIEEKYGSLEMSFIASELDGLSQVKFTRSKLNDKNMKEYLKDLELNMLNNEKKYNILINRFFNHIKKYHLNWWN